MFRVEFPLRVINSMFYNDRFFLLFIRMSNWKCYVTLKYGAFRSYQ